MTRVLVLYYSSYGHIEKMAGAVAEGVKEAGAEAIIKRVPELVPEEIAKKSHFKLDQPAPLPNCPTTTQSSWACPRATATCRHR